MGGEEQGFFVSVNNLKARESACKRMRGKQHPKDNYKDRLRRGDVDILRNIVEMSRLVGVARVRGRQRLQLLISNHSTIPAKTV